MKQSKVKKAVNASGDDAEKKAGVGNVKTEKNNAPTAKTPENKIPEKTETDKQPDLLIRFQTMEWHILTLAGAKMEKDLKQERLDKMLGELGQIGVELKKVSRKKFGLSAQTVDTRIDLTGELAKKIIVSGKQFDMANSGQVSKQIQAAMNKYEASEWQVLEQSLKAKAAAGSKDGKQQETEQEKLFKSADTYYGSAAELAKESDNVGIPKEIVQMRTEQRLNHMGDDPDLKDMRNPSPDAYMLSGGAAFVHYVKELIEKLAKAIKFLMTQQPTENADSQAPSVKKVQSAKKDAAATKKEDAEPQTAPAAASVVRL